MTRSEQRLLTSAIRIFRRSEAAGFMVNAHVLRLHDIQCRLEDESITILEIATGDWELLLVVLDFFTFVLWTDSATTTERLRAATPAILNQVEAIRRHLIDCSRMHCN